jgi:cell division protein FtsZ
MLDMDGRGVAPARITLIGLGGGGSNAVNRMLTEGLRDVNFWVANTDSQALESSICENRIQLGVALTGGLGAGGDPEIGRAAAEEDGQTLTEILEGYDMVFVTAGMGGGTGTGAAPVVARIARSLGALTVGIVTRPFLFEGTQRSRRAEEGLRLLAEEVDTLIVIPNDKLLHLVDRSANLQSGLRVADEVLFQATRGISDIITGNGLINVDFADVRTVMHNKGAALLGCGVASGPNRALEAAQAAVSSPLLDEVSIDGATAILVNVVGGPDMGFHEVTESAQYVSQQAGKDCDVYWGAVVDPSLSMEMRVTLIATGFQRTPAITKVSRAPLSARPGLTSPAPAPARQPIPAANPEPSPALVDTPETILTRRSTPRVLSLPEREPAISSVEESQWDPSFVPERIEGDGWDSSSQPDARPEPADPWIEEAPEPEPESAGAGRGPALWLRRPTRRLRLPDRLSDFKSAGRNPLDIPTYLRKQMD